MAKPAKRAKGHTAVMADKAAASAIEAEADPVRRLHLQINYFPTPPWATRALLEHVIGDVGRDRRTTCWEPAAGEGHMADVLAERFAGVWRTDVHNHGARLDAVGSFVGSGLDVIAAPDERPDWVITNPPFALGLDFLERALDTAREGVALLLRTSWLEGQERWERIFSAVPPARVAVFVERVPMTLGRWDPEADTATAYAWFVWRRAERRAAQSEAAWATGGSSLIWIPPGCRQRLEHPLDRQRFTTPASTDPTLFDRAAMAEGVPA